MESQISVTQSSGGSQPIARKTRPDYLKKSNFGLNIELKERGLPYIHTGLREIKILRLRKDDADKRRAILDKNLSAFNDENDERGTHRESLCKAFLQNEYEILKAEFEAAEEELERVTADLDEAKAAMVEATRLLAQEQEADQH